MQIYLAGAYFDIVEGLPDFATAFPNSLATQTALQEAYDRGDWQPYTPPEPEPETEQAEPNWSEFRLSLMVSPTFRAWGKELPADWREDLKMAALAANFEALQKVYNHLANLYPPSETAVEEWQQLANDSHIPLAF